MVTGIVANHFLKAILNNVPESESDGMVSCAIRDKNGDFFYLDFCDSKNLYKSGPLYADEEDIFVELNEAGLNILGDNVYYLINPSFTGLNMSILHSFV